MTEEFMQYAQKLKTQKLFETEDFFQASAREHIPQFQNNFRILCEQIGRMQKDGSLGVLSYLEFTLLHTNVILGKDTAEVRVYDDNWYFDSRQRIAGQFDYSFLSVCYRELCSQLLSARKRFAGIHAHDIRAFLLSSASEFYRYVAAFCRMAILECTATEAFQSLQRADEFEIHAGEYMAYTESVYRENRTKNAKDALKWLSKRLEYDYAYEDFSGLDFTNADLSETDLRYADFRSTILCGADLQEAMLAGTRFHHADMRNADLRYCLLHEADFTGADLSGACFSYAKAYSGISSRKKWMAPGFARTDFTKARLCGADFRKAAIRDAVFQDAVMDGALFFEHQLEQYDLSAAQKKAVCITSL